MHYKKTIKLLTTTLLLLAICRALPAQESAMMKELRSKGIPPADFTTDVLYKTQNLNEEWKIADKGYIIQSNHFLNKILGSGKVIYGDTLTKLINRIADRLLEKNPGLRKELRFYTLRSTIPNAMCLQQGIVLVSTGLMATVKDENELAFVISHEIAHYLKKHSLKTYKYRKEQLKELSNKNTIDLEREIKKFYQYSKENETEADAVGYQMYIAAGYPASAATSVLSKLKSWDHFIAETYAPKAFAADSIYPANQAEELVNESGFAPDISKFVKLYSKTSVIEEHEHEFNTHPSLDKRIARLGQIQGKKTEARTDTVSSFYNYYRNLAIFDVAFLSYLNGSYAKSIYLLEYLYREGINDPFMDLLRYAGLYRYQAAFRNFRTNNAELTFESNSENENRVYYFITNMCENKYIINLYLSCQKKYAANNNTLYLKLADAYVNNMDWDKADDENPIPEEIKGKKESSQPAYEFKVKKKNKNMFIGYNEFFKSADSIMILIPSITESIYLKRIKRKYLKEEKAQQTIYQAYKVASKNLDLSARILDNRIGSNFNTDAYNQYCMANEWMTERFSWDTITPVLLLSNISIEGDSQMAQIEYISAANMNYIVHERVFNPWLAAGMAIFPPTFPVLLGWAFIPQKDIFSLNMLINLKTGNMEYLSWHRYNSRFSKDIISAHAYKTMSVYKKGLK